MGLQEAVLAVVLLVVTGALVSNVVGRWFLSRWNELLARIRRTLAIRAGTQPQSLSFENGKLQIDESQRRVQLDGETVSLTRKEWAVLLHLVQANGGLVTQTSLLQEIWGATHLDDTQYLRNVIQKLRQKLKRPRKRKL